MDDRAFFRFGALAAIGGGVLALAGNLLHPRYTNLDNVVIYRRIAASSRFVIADLIIIGALILTAAGFMAIARYVGGPIGRYGRYAAVAGAAIALAQTGVETFGLKQEAIVFAHANRVNVVGAFWATNAIDHLNNGLFGMWTALFLGLAPLLIGIAWMRKDDLPSWGGIVAIAGGLVCTAVGFWNLSVTDQDPIAIPFLVGSLLVTAWIIVAGVMLWSRSEATAAA